jgi:hypothetical protein
MAETGQTYTQAAVSLAAPAQMNRDLPPSAAAITLMFAEIMAAGRRAAIAASDDLAEAAAAVRAALTPIWPQVVPEAARDALTACAQIAVSRGVTELPPAVSNITAATMLELTAGWAAAGSPGPGARFTVHDDDWLATCPECGGDDPQGTYGCQCWDPSACAECGGNSGTCGCWD